MKSFELRVARVLPRGACHWLNLGTLLCLSWAMAAAAPTVELLCDSWGTSHIFAASEADGFFGLGYAAAEDRLLPMELIGRKAAGRLAEVFGPDWVDADREAHPDAVARRFKPLGIQPEPRTPTDCLLAAQRGPHRGLSPLPGTGRARWRGRGQTPVRPGD